MEINPEVNVPVIREAVVRSTSVPDYVHLTYREEEKANLEK